MPKVKHPKDKGSKDKFPKPEEIFDRIIDGDAIVVAAREANAEFFKKVFLALDERIKAQIKLNVPDPKRAKYMELFCDDMIKLLATRVGDLLSDTGRARGGRSGSS